MATNSWKQSLERVGKQFSECEAVELTMIRDETRTSHVSPDDYLADLLSDAANLARRSESEMRRNLRGFTVEDPKAGSYYFYALSLLTMPVVEADALWSTLKRLFEAAGNLLRDIPPAISEQLDPLAFSLSEPRRRWAACVFCHALKLKRIQRRRLVGQPSHGCWYATLENVMATSADLIDWLLAADETPSGASTGGIDAVPKKKPEAAGQGGKGTVGESSTAEVATNAKKRKPLRPHHWQVYFAHKYAESKEERQLWSWESLKYWVENGFDEKDSETKGVAYLRGFDPTAYSEKSFREILSHARNHPEIDDPRNEKRKGNTKGQKRRNKRKLADRDEKGVTK